MEENKLLQEAKDKIAKKDGHNSFNDIKHIDIETNDFINEVALEYSLLLERSKWIDVSVQEPPKDKAFLSFFGAIDIFRWDEKAKKYIDYYYKDKYSLTEITHWQPLPHNP